MRTYNDFLKVGDSGKADFIASARLEFIFTPEYRIADDAELYYRHLNPSIMRAQKIVYNMLGKAIPDVYAANHKIPSRWYFYFIAQEVGYLFGNGVTFQDSGTKEKLGKNFDTQMQKIAQYALNGGAAYGFWNMDHLDVFKFTEFVPLYDENDGALKAGIRWWQLDNNKPIRATLYELDGYTEYISPNADGAFEVYQEKRAYKLLYKATKAGGKEIYAGENYDGFPIVPFYNIAKQSELIGGRETIDAYDLMASELVNSVDDGNLIYWVLKNCGGMDASDDAKFIEQLKITHVAHADGDEGASVEAHQVVAPIDANDKALSRLRNQLFDDFMALDVKEIASGATTATQIKAAYEPLNSKTDLFEYCAIEFIEGVLKLAGIDDTPSFKRSMIINQAEETNMILSAAQYLDDETIIRKLPFLSTDEADEVLRRADEMAMNRISTNDESDEGDEGEGEWPGIGKEEDGSGPDPEVDNPENN